MVRELLNTPIPDLKGPGHQLACVEFTTCTGYLVIKNFTDTQQLKDLRDRAAQLLESFDPQEVSVFSTKNQVIFLFWLKHSKGNGFERPQHLMTTSTKVQTKTSNDYFNESANNISFFFEENAFGDNGELRQPKALSINKIGHGMASPLSQPVLLYESCTAFCGPAAAMHDLDPSFREWSRSQKIAEALSELGFQKPLPVQSMYICKVWSTSLSS